MIQLYDMIVNVLTEKVTKDEKLTKLILCVALCLLLADYAFQLGSYIGSFLYYVFV